MRKLFVIVLVLLSTITFAQGVVVKDLGVIANGDGQTIEQTGYLDLSAWSKVDSVSLTYIGKGELDVDTVDIYGAVKLPNGSFVKDATIMGTYTVTLNLAASTNDIEPLVVTGATVMTGAKLRGLNAIFYETRGASSGNDATDPNRGYLAFKIHGTK